jgi:thymidylate kinase/8-oxo-dGTP pyrophosphatase MutT (NUDIX family)
VESKLKFKANSDRDKYSGAVIAVEGIDNVGKSTVVASLALRLHERGYLVTVLEEFGSDLVGQAIRNLVRSSWSEVPAEAQPLLIAADRYPRYSSAFAKLGNPRSIVLCDRYLHSAIIYQALSSGTAPGEMLQTIRALYGTSFRPPDLILLLEASVETAAARGGTNIHNREFLSACAAYLKDLSLGETKVSINAEAARDDVLQQCEAAILREIPCIARVAVPPIAVEYLQSRYSGEVLFALCCGDSVFLQRKAGYPAGAYRIAGGGIEEQESVVQALSRELYEETGLLLQSLDYRLVTVMNYNNDSGADAFVSYLFQINIAGNCPINAGPAPDEGFEEWKAFTEEEMRLAVLKLRAVTPDRADWAAFRAAAMETYLAIRD